MSGQVRPLLDVQLLGEFYLLYDGRPLTAFFQGRLQTLLAYLLLHRHVPQSRQQIAFLFWPNTVEHQARNNLRQLLHYLRSTLPSAEQFVVADAKTIQWRPDASYRLDVADFEQSLAQASVAVKKGDTSAEREVLERAVQRYSGELLPGCYDDWLLKERERLSQACVEAYQRLILLAESEPNYESAIVYGERLLSQDPLHESTYRTLIRLHALRGDRAAAARVYERCVKALKRELSVEPAADTIAAFRRALNVETPSLMPSPHEDLTPAAGIPLINREEAWAKMQTVWQSAASGMASMALISGEAGMGKTRLAEEMLRWAGDKGTTVARTRALEAEGQLAYAPIVRLLRSEPCRSQLSTLESVWRTELAQLLPELSGKRPALLRKPIAAGEGQRLRLFEAMAQAALINDAPCLLFFDDMQWADRDTIEWLHYLLTFRAKAMLLILGAMRPEEVHESHPLATLRLDWRVRISEIELGPFGLADTVALAERVASLHVDASMAASLYCYTEGNPRFIVETIRAVLKARQVSSTPLIAEDLLPFRSRPPKKVEVIIEGRLRRISTEAQEIVGLAATIGRVFTTEVLLEASERGEETAVQALEELSRRRIVSELDSATYRFSHGCICQIAYKRISAARRLLFHRRVAGALERVYAGRLSAVTEQIAHHYRQAGKPGTSDQHSAKIS